MDVLEGGKVVHKDVPMRNALNEAYVASGLTPPSYTDAIVAGVTPVKAAHIAEVRAAILTIE